MQTFHLFCTQKTTLFIYFTHSFLQNTHISLSILHIYLIEYSLFYFFLLLSLTASFSHRPKPRPNTLSQTNTPSQTQTQTQHAKKSREYHKYAILRTRIRMQTIQWGWFLAEREKGERDSRWLGIRFAFRVVFASGVVPFSRPLACELCCCCRRLVLTVWWSKWLASWIGLLVWFVDPDPGFFVVNFLYFLFGWWESGGKE